MNNALKTGDQELQRMAAPARRVTWILAAVAIVLIAAVAAYAFARSRARADAERIRARANNYARHAMLYHAITDFEELIRRNPNDADAWQRVGILYRVTGQLGRGWDALSKAAQLNPHDTYSRVAMGMLGPHLGRLKESETALRQVLDQDPTNPDALTSHASLLIRLDPTPHGLSEAEDEIKEAIAVRPAGPAYDTLGQIHRAQRRFKDAIHDFQDAIAVEPRARSHYMFLSQCYAAVGDARHAREAMVQYEKLPRAGQPPDTPKAASAGHTQM